MTCTDSLNRKNGASLFLGLCHARVARWKCSLNSAFGRCTPGGRRAGKRRISYRYSWHPLRRPETGHVASRNSILLASRRVEDLEGLREAPLGQAARGRHGGQPGAQELLQLVHVPGLALVRAQRGKLAVERPGYVDVAVGLRAARQ